MRFAELLAATRTDLFLLLLFVSSGINVCTTQRQHSKSDNHSKSADCMRSQCDFCRKGGRNDSFGCLGRLCLGFQQESAALEEKQKS